MADQWNPENDEQMERPAPSEDARGRAQDEQEDDEFVETGDLDNEDEEDEGGTTF